MAGLSPTTAAALVGIVQGGADITEDLDLARSDLTVLVALVVEQAETGRVGSVGRWLETKPRRSLVLMYAASLRTDLDGLGWGEVLVMAATQTVLRDALLEGLDR